MMRAPMMAQVTVPMPPCGVKLWAVLPKKPKAPVRRVAEGAAKPGSNVTLTLRQKDAPRLTCYRLEVRDALNQTLPGLASNILIRDGAGELTIALPYNLPAGSRIIVTDVLSGQSASVAIRNR